MKRHIDISFEAIGQRWRVVGAFTPALPSRRDSPAESAQWDDVRVSMVVGEYETPDLSELLDSLQAPGRIGSALADVLKVAGRAARTPADDQVIERATRVLKLGGLL